MAKITVTEDGHWIWPSHQYSPRTPEVRGARRIAWAMIRGKFHGRIENDCGHPGCCLPFHHRLVRYRTRKGPNPRIAQALELWNDYGLSTVEIAERLGCSRWTIWRILKS